MRIFVSGASGFIGAHFIETALAAGHEVVGLYRAERPDNRELLHHLASLGARLRRGHLFEAETLEHGLQDCDVVCHFAAAFKEAGAGEEHFQRVNVSGTEALLETAARQGVKRFVFCSTAGIYGRCVEGVIDERSQAQPWNEYERSKFDAETRVREQALALGMEYVILRPSVVYGPRDPRLSKLFKAALKGRFPLFGRGNGRRHMVYVSDVAEAFLAACTHPRAGNSEVIVAGPKAVPLRELLETLAAVIGRRRCGPQLPLAPMLGLAAVVEDVCKVLKIKPLLYRRRMDFYLNDAAFDCSRAREVLDWEPKVSLREGLGKTLRSYPPDSGGAPLVWSNVLKLSVAGEFAIQTARVMW